MCAKAKLSKGLQVLPVLPYPTHKSILSYFDLVCKCLEDVSGSTWQVDIRKITDDDVSQLHLRNSQPRNGSQDEYKL